MPNYLSRRSPGINACVTTSLDDCQSLTNFFSKPDCMECVMPTPRERARHSMSRAEECLRLAELVETDELRNKYREIAGRYTALANAEMALANGAKVTVEQASMD
jgi:hypothetical protein